MKWRNKDIFPRKSVCASHDKSWKWFLYPKWKREPVCHFSHSTVFRVWAFRRTNNESNPLDNKQLIYPSLSLFLHPSTTEQLPTLTQRMAFNHNLRLAQIFIDPGVACDTICHIRVLMKISELLSLWIAQKVSLLISNQSFRVYFNDKASNSEWKFSTGANVISILFNISLNVIPAILPKFSYADKLHLAPLNSLIMSVNYYCRFHPLFFFALTLVCLQTFTVSYWIQFEF